MYQKCIGSVSVMQHDCTDVQRGYSSKALGVFKNPKQLNPIKGGPSIRNAEPQTSRAVRAQKPKI